MKSLGDVEVEGFVLLIRNYHAEFITSKEMYSGVHTDRINFDCQVRGEDAVPLEYP